MFDLIIYFVIALAFSIDTTYRLIGRRMCALEIISVWVVGICVFLGIVVKIGDISKLLGELV